MLVNAPVQGFIHRFRLGRNGHDAEQVRRSYQRRHRQRHCVRRHLVNACKTTVVYLLLSANLVQFYGLDRLFVLKIRYGRVVESDMSVFPNPHNDDIRQIFVQKLCFYRA